MGQLAKTEIPAAVTVGLGKARECTAHIDVMRSTTFIHVQLPDGTPVMLDFRRQEWDAIRKIRPPGD